VSKRNTTSPAPEELAVSLEPAAGPSEIASADVVVADPLADRIALLEVYETDLKLREVQAAKRQADAELAISGANAKQAEYEQKLQSIAEGAVHVIQQQTDLAKAVEVVEAKKSSIRKALAVFNEAVQ
jgi:hypothetical protein